MTDGYRPTGRHLTLSGRTDAGEATAVVTEVAAGLRLLEIAGTRVTETFDELASRPFGTGIALAPWTNRVRDGVWTLDGKAQLLDHNEPDRGNALHGLLRNAPYSVAVHERDAVVLEAPIHPQHGYPFHLATAVEYTIGAGGLTVTHSVVNLTPRPAPVAAGSHPFFAVGGIPSERLLVQVSADHVYEVDERRNPVRVAAVAGTDYDLRSPRLLGETDLDHVYRTTPDADGWTRHRLIAPDGRAVVVAQDPSFGWTQVMTPRTFPGPDGPHLAIAVEPQSAAPDAFNTGEGLRWLAEGETFAATWTVYLEQA